MYDYVSHCLHDAICDACCFHVGLPLLPGLILSQRIVVVDDIQTNRLIAGRVLRAFGAHVEFAEDGKGACEAVAQARLPFHLILMDCHMPVMDGVSLSVSKMHCRALLRTPVARSPYSSTHVAPFGCWPTALRLTSQSLPSARRHSSPTSSAA